LIAGLGTSAAAIALVGTPAAAQTASAFQPARHTEDGWFANRPGKHRVILDTTTPEAIPDAIRFAGNLFTGNKVGYSVDEGDVAIVICLRHSATVYAYNDALWSKYGRALRGTEVAGAAPSANPYNSGERAPLSDLAKRGVQFMVCGTASRGAARRVAGATGDADAVFKEIEAGLIPNARLVAAGVVGVTHAQEYGYSYLFVG
jgi:intracellular sulfur oxidation DsrE/DsrF family protein